MPTLVLPPMKNTLVRVFAFHNHPASRHLCPQLHCVYRYLHGTGMRLMAAGNFR